MTVPTITPPRRPVQMSAPRRGMSLAERERQRQDRLINDIVSNFEREFSKDNVMTKSEFEPYMVLFSVDMRARAVQKTIDPSEEAVLAELSDEFYFRVNPYKPIHIVDDHTREVLYTLPPLMTKLKMLKEDDSAARLANAISHDDGAACSPSAIQTLEALDAMNYSFVLSQDRNDIVSQQRAFNAMANKMDTSGNTTGKGHLKGTVPQQAQQQQQKVSATPPQNQYSDPTDDFF